MIRFEDYLDFEVIRKAGAKSLREYACNFLFEAIEKRGITLQEASEEVCIPYEKIIRYRSRSIPITGNDLATLNLLVCIGQERFIPIRKLTEQEKFLLWQENRSHGSRALTASCPEEDESGIEDFLKKRNLYDTEIEEMGLQRTWAAVRLQDKLNDPSYDVLVPPQ